MTTIPEALRAAAEQAGLTDTQIAAAVGVSQQTVGSWKAGRKSPRGKHLMALVDVVPGFGARLGLHKHAAAQPKAVA